MAEVRQVRDGNIVDVYPEWFPEDFPHSVAANFIDVAARDLSELMAPVPTLECSSGTATSQAAKAFASKKTNIGYSYWYHCQLDRQLFTGCDQYTTYGFLPILVEPDWDAEMPLMALLDPMGCYYQLDRSGKTRSFAQVLRMTAGELAEWFPEYATEILAPKMGQAGRMVSSGADEIELIRFLDDTRSVTYLPERKDLVLADVPHGMDFCPVQVVERPGLSGVRGQFDDAVSIQMARARMAWLGLEAAEKSVQAPLAVPDDVQTIPLGGDAVIRSRTPQGIRRVGMEMSPAAFQTEPMLEQELRLGTRYPDARSGDMTGSVVTGRGVQALLGQIDTQLKTAQAMLAHGLARATEMCFQMDVKLWPAVTKTVKVVFGGQSITETYRPSKDIKDDWRCDCVYGFAAGLGVNQAVVMIEQMINGGLIDRATGRRHLPLGEDPAKLERAINVQQIRDGLSQGIVAMAQSANVMMEQGQDPSKLFGQLADITSMLAAGDAIEDIVKQVFPPPPPPPPTPAALPGAAGGAGGPGGPGAPPGSPGQVPPGMTPTTGLPAGTAVPGQPPGGRPPLQMLMAGLSPSGQANLSDNVASRVPGR